MIGRSLLTLLGFGIIIALSPNYSPDWVGAALFIWFWIGNAIPVERLLSPPVIIRNRRGEGD